MTDLTNKSDVTARIEQDKNNKMQKKADKDRQDQEDKRNVDNADRLVCEINGRIKAIEMRYNDLNAIKIDRLELKGYSEQTVLDVITQNNNVSDPHYLQHTPGSKWLIIAIHKQDYDTARMNAVFPE
jgi:hypothetical protein